LSAIFKFSSYSSYASSTSAGSPPPPKLGSGMCTSKYSSSPSSSSTYKQHLSFQIDGKVRVINGMNNNILFDKCINKLITMPIYI
jgi:hypothetical protein